MWWYVVLVLKNKFATAYSADPLEEDPSLLQYVSNTKDRKCIFNWRKTFMFGTTL